MSIADSFSKTPSFADNSHKVTGSFAIHGTGRGNITKGSFDPSDKASPLKLECQFTDGELKRSGDLSGVDAANFELCDDELEVAGVKRLPPFWSNEVFVIGLDRVGNARSAQQ